MAGGIQIASLFASIGADTSGLEKGLSNTKAGLEGLAGDVGKIGTGFGGLVMNIGGMMFGLNQALDLTAKVADGVKRVMDDAREGAALAAMEQAASDLATTMGISMADVVASVTKASQGMVAETDIIRSSARALILGVGRSADDLAKLMEVAVARGRVMGMSATDAFNDIVTGIGRLSPQILDNLGIVLDSASAYDAYAKSIGVTSKELTNIEKKQALVNSTIEATQPLIKEMGNFGDDAEASFSRWEAASKTWKDNFKKDISEVFKSIPAFGAAILEGANEAHAAAPIFDDLFNRLNSSLASGTITREQYNQVLAIANEESKNYETRLDAISAAERKLNQITGTTIDQIDKLNSSQEDLVMNFFRTSTGWSDFTSKMESASISLGMITEDLYNSERAAIGLSTELGIVDARMFAVQSANLGTLRQDFEETADALRSSLLVAYSDLNIAVDKWNLGVSGGLKGKLDEDFDRGIILLEKYKTSLDILDKTYGTNYVMEFEMKLKMDELYKQLLSGDISKFQDAAKAFETSFAPLNSAVAEAMANIDALQAALEKVEREYNAKIVLTIETIGGLPKGIDTWSFTGGIGSTVTGRATGGYGMAGTPYLVGERGPELFVPETNGRVYTTAQTGAMLGGSNAGLMDAIARIPTAQDIAMAVRDALLMVG